MVQRLRCKDTFCQIDWFGEQRDLEVVTNEGEYPLLGGHRKVLQAIMRCRTGLLGSVWFECSSCGSRHWVGRLWQPALRDLPSRQDTNVARQQTKRLMPVHHFMVTFTVPKPVRQVLRAHQREGYTALFQASRETITGLLSNPKFLGCGRAGFLGVLHTWGRDPMVYHPHVHYIVPGGGVNPRRCMREPADIHR